MTLSSFLYGLILIYLYRHQGNKWQCSQMDEHMVNDDSNKHGLAINRTFKRSGKNVHAISLWYYQTPSPDRANRGMKTEASSSFWCAHTRMRQRVFVSHQFNWLVPARRQADEWLEASTLSVCLLSVTGGARPRRVQRETEWFCSHDNSSRMIIIVTRDASITTMQCNPRNNREVPHQVGSVCAGRIAYWWVTRRSTAVKRFMQVTVHFELRN
jgi:hypothetical protein